MTVELPKKHGRGGQSAVRFARQREEKRAAYLKKVAELTNGHFISDDRPNVKGLVLAGSASFKNMLQESDHFDKRLAELVVSVVDVSYGGDNGFNQAIQLASDAISNVKFVQEKKIVSKFFENISMDTGMVVFGVDDTMKAFEEGNAERLMMFENLETMRYVVKNPVKGEE
jgi:peptide chain release factor subunit 1